MCSSDLPLGGSILHCHPEVVKAVQDAAAQGLGFGAPTAGELDLANLLCTLLPSLEMVRLVSSGPRRP